MDEMACHESSGVDVGDGNGGCGSRGGMDKRRRGCEKWTWGGYHGGRCWVVLVRKKTTARTPAREITHTFIPQFAASIVTPWSYERTTVDN